MSDYTGSSFIPAPIEDELTGLETLINDNKDANTATQAALDQEIIDRGAADTQLQTQINGSATEGALTAEITARTDADAALGVLITNNTNAIGTNTANLAQEIIDRGAADTGLQTQITNNSNAIGTNAANLTQEITDRTNADNNLQNEINDRALTLSLNNEITARTDADTALGARIDFEASTRSYYISNLQGQITTNGTAITAEETARQSADATLQASITANATAISTKANDSDVVKLTGTQTIAGEKTFTNDTYMSSDLILADDEGKIILGTNYDRKIYRTADGIRTDDTMDASQYLVEGTQIASTNLSDGATLVKTSGDQTIGGIKTYTDDQIVDNIIVNTAIKSAQNAGLDFLVNSGGVPITAMKLLSNATTEMEGKTSFKQGIIGHLSQSLTAGTRLIDNVRLITKLDTRAGNIVCTISNGTADGQIKIISLHRADPQYTATLLTNVSEPLTFKNIGEGCILSWSGNTADWSVVAKNVSFLNNDLEVGGDVNLTTGHEFKVNGVPISGGMTPTQEAQLATNTTNLSNLYDNTPVTLKNIINSQCSFNCRTNSLEYVEDAMHIGQIPQDRIFELNDDLDLKRSLTNNLFPQLNLNGTTQSMTSAGGTINDNDYFCKFDLTGQTAELVVGIAETNVPYQTKIIFIDVEGTANLVIRSGNIMGSQDIILRKRGDCVFLHADWLSSKWKVIGIHTNVQPTLNTAGNITSGNDIICTRNLFSNSAANTEIDGFTSINLRSLTGVTPTINIDGQEAFMTKATNQTITGVKTFENGIVADLNISQTVGLQSALDEKQIRYLPCLIEHHENSGVDGGTSAATQWNDIVLNVIDNTLRTDYTILNNQITFSEIGTYKVSFSVASYSTIGTKAEVIGVTDTAKVVHGTSFTTTNASGGAGTGLGIITTTQANEVFKLRLYSEGSGLLGKAVSSGSPETYAQVLIKRLS